MATVRVALSDETTPAEFLQKFGVEKPDKDKYIIFTCRSGRRSLIASKIAANELGYTKYIILCNSTF